MYFEIDDFNALRDALHTMCDELYRSFVCEQTVFDCKLVAGELLSNVLQHGGGRAFCTVSLDGGTLRMSVKGERDFRPPTISRCSDVTSERGRGLYLVDSVSESRSYSEEEGISVIVKVLYREK